MKGKGGKRKESTISARTQGKPIQQVFRQSVDFLINSWKEGREGRGGRREGEGGKGGKENVVSKKKKQRKKGKRRNTALVNRSNSINQMVWYR